MIKKSIKRDSLIIRLSHFLQDEEATHIVDFEGVFVFNILFIPYLLRNGDSALHTYSNNIFGHAYCLQLRLYGFAFWHLDPMQWNP